MIAMDHKLMQNWKVKNFFFSAFLVLRTPKQMNWNKQWHNLHRRYVATRFFIVNRCWYEQEWNFFVLMIDCATWHELKLCKFIQIAKNVFEAAFWLFLLFFSFADEAFHLDIACTSSMSLLSWDFVSWWFAAPPFTNRLSRSSDARQWDEVSRMLHRKFNSSFNCRETILGSRQTIEKWNFTFRMKFPGKCFIAIRNSERQNIRYHPWKRWWMRDEPRKQLDLRVKRASLA